MGEGGFWLGNGYLSFEFLSVRKSECLVGGLCIPEKLCLQDNLGEKGSRPGCHVPTVTLDQCYESSEHPPSVTLM